MRRNVKIFVIYFPVILVSCQVMANLLFFISPDNYNAWGVVLGTLFGTNAMFAVFLVAFTFMFRFCAISRWSACAELLFAAYYLIIQQDDIYNILFQITAGSLAILFTGVHYIRKYPLCNLSLLVSFIKSWLQTGSKTKAYRIWDKKTEHKLQQNRT